MMMYGLEAFLNGGWTMTDRQYEALDEAQREKTENEQHFDKPFRVVKIEKIIESVLDNPYYPVKVNQVILRKIRVCDKVIKNDR